MCYILHQHKSIFLFHGSNVLKFIALWPHQYLRKLYMDYWDKIIAFRKLTNFSLENEKKKTKTLFWGKLVPFRPSLLSRYVALFLSFWDVPPAIIIWHFCFNRKKGASSRKNSSKCSKIFLHWCLFSYDLRVNIMDCKSLWFHLAREIWSFFCTYE